MFNKYYQDELTFLREVGAEFGRKHASIADLLSDTRSDPDVERLMEGFAFIAGQLRQKIDDELPELTHTLIGLLWPHYLRPVPSMTIVEFAPRNDVTAVQHIPRGITLHSRPAEETVCKFRTSYEVTLAPIAIDGVEMESSPSEGESLRLRIKMLNGVDRSALDLPKLRLHFHGDAHISYELYLRLAHQVSGVRVQALKGGRPGQHFDLPPSAIEPLGLAAEDSILDYPEHTFPGYRLLQEYFALPEKFLFLDVAGLERLGSLEGDEDVFEVIFQFARQAETSLTLNPQNILLHCTPAVNLFKHHADPISVDHRRTEYRARPTCDRIEHYEVHSVDKVTGIMQGTAKRVDYRPFYEFSHHGEEENEGRGFYQARVRESGRPREEDEEIEVYRVTNLRDSPVGYGNDTYLTFVGIDPPEKLSEGGRVSAGEIAVPSAETISLELTCSNRHLAEKLRVADVCMASGDSPEFATFRNIMKPTGSVNPPLDSGLHWRLISHLSLNFLSLLDVDALRGILELYNLQAFYDRQAARLNEQRLAGIVSIRHEPSEWIRRGSPIRGRAIHIEMDEDNFAGEGDLFMFASVLNEFFAAYASMNSFTKLTVRGVRRGEVYQWPRRLGQQIIL